MKADAQAAGFDPRRLERIEDHLRRRYLDPVKIAGCQVAVWRHGSLGYFASLGLADLERGVPVAEDTIWRIYSMTKPLTGVALLTLYEKGMFRLDDPVHRFIPEWRDLKVREGGTLVAPRRPMTVKDLLMHMSGLGYGPGNASLDLGSRGDLGRVPRMRSDHSLAEMVERLASTPLRFHPGGHWLYSLSTDVCARLVEILSGRRFDEYLHEAVLEPLEMLDTAFWVDQARAGRLAAMYARSSSKRLVLIEDRARSSYLVPPTFLSGGGGLVSTTADYLRFCLMLLGGGELGGRRVLSRKTIELMCSNHLPGGGELSQFALPGSHGEVTPAGMGFGLTVAVSLGPVATAQVGSPGEVMWGGAASTVFWVDTAEDLAAVFMTQLMPSGTFDFRGQLKAIVYGAIAD